MEGARRGDEDSARALMEQLYPLVLKIVRAYLPRRMSEEDLVQTVFMKVFSRLPQFLGQVPIEHWVSRIAVNTCFNALKAEKIRPECRWSDLSDEEKYVVETLAVKEDPSPNYCGSGAKELLNRLLSSLSAEDRLVIQLLHLEEKSVAHIADVTGWSVEAVKVRAFRARKKLQEHLKRMESGECRMQNLGNEKLKRMETGNLESKMGSGKRAAGLAERFVGLPRRFAESAGRQPRGPVCIAA